MRKETSTNREKPAALAKLTRPRLHGAVPRERLFQRLDDLLEHPTVWVTGPPGSGKTSLLSGYVESRRRPTLWYQLDGGDADVATFFHYLGVAAQDLAAGRRAHPLPALTPEYLLDLFGFTRRFFRELFARVPRSSLFVLDDYQEVPSGSPLHGVLACALAELPEGVGCAIASRAGPSAECARLVANQAIATLDWQDLRLTEEETSAIAHARQVIDRAAIAEAHQRSDGWVAGLILLLGQPTMAGVARASVLATSSKSLFDYFSSIFASTLDDETRAVLLDVALLPSVTGRIASRVSGSVNAEHLLRMLYERSSFVDRGEGSEPTYRLHSLFREFLLEFLRQNQTSHERLRKLRQTADALLACGEHEKAAVLYGEAGDWEQAASVVACIAPQLLVQGRWQTLQSRIAAFPESEFSARPWLQYWLGASLLAVNFKLARATLVNAHEGFARSQDVTGQLLAAAAAMQTYFIEYGEFSGLDPWIDTLEALLTKNLPFANPAIELQVISNMVLALSFRAPWHPGLMAYASRLLDLAQSDADPNERIIAAGALSSHLSWVGDLEADRQARAAARPLLTRAEILPLRKVWVLGCLASSAYTRADHDESDALFARAFAITETHGWSQIESWLRLCDCWHRLDRGECKAVGSILAKQERTVEPARYLDVSLFRFVKGWHALLEGKLVLARQEAEAAVALAVQSGAPKGESFTLLLLTEVLIELREYAQANACLVRFRTRFGGIRSALFEFHALLVDAFCALSQGDEARCAHLLEAGFAIGRTHGYLNALFWYDRMMARLCRFALDRGIEGEYVRLLIQRRRLRPEVPVENWPWLAKIYALGRFEMHANGEELRFSGKAQRKPLELAKVLVALGARDVPAEALIDVLWPEPSEGDGQKALEITIHRLRKLLGSEETVRVSDRRVTLDPQLVWVDAAALEHTLAPLVAAPHAAEPAIELLEAAAAQVLHLYRGQFLAGEAGRAWNMPMRNRLDGRFQRYALRLGEHWESRREWQRAAALYQRVVELDPLAEAFYRRQMGCLEAQGRIAEAIELYRRCREMLSVTLGVAPTAETAAAYRRLLATGDR